MQDGKLGLLIGGVVPAVLFGLSGVLAKSAAGAGIPLGPYLFSIGVSIAIVGVLASLFSGWTGTNVSGIGYSVLQALAWTGGVAGVMIALERYKVPIAKLVPVYNANTLVTVLLGLWIFAEWKELAVARLMLGTLLMFGGGVLVAKA